MGEKKEPGTVSQMSALRPFLVIIAAAFSAEILIMYLLSFMNNLSDTQAILLDASLHVAILLPVLYLAVYRPLKQYIEKVQQGSDAYRESELRLKTLVDAMPAAVYFKDGDGRWIYVNRAGLLPFQLEDLDYRGKTDAELGGMVPFHREALLYCQRTDADAWDLGRASVAEETLPQPDGSAYIFDTIKIPTFKDDGSRKGLIVIGRDITETRKTEDERARLATAVEQSADTIIITDLEGTIQYVNPAFEKTTGYAKGEVTGKNARVLSAKHQDPAFYRAMWTTILQGEVWGGRLINKRKDGELFEVDATLSPIRSAAGTITNFVAIERDLTHEIMLKKAREYFTAVTSHELYTPLTKLQMIKVLLGNLRPFMTNEEKLDEASHFLIDVYGEFERIISATTLFTTLSTPGPKETFQPLFLYHELMGCINDASDAATQAKRKLTLDVRLDSLPKDAMVKGDGAMMARCIQEILSNAVKYTPDGGSITVSGAVEGGQAVLEVKDTGIGIPAEKKKQALEPFFSFENPGYHSTGQYKFKGGGLGLGLTLALMVMEYHGGKLSIESSGENSGTAVTLRLPLNDHP